MKQKIDAFLPSEHYFGNRIVEQFVKKKSTDGEEEMLDVGCGTSPFREFFSNMDYTGVDKFEEREDIIQADAHELPFEENSFDLVLCTEVIEHTEKPRKVLSEINRVLKDGGELILTTPQTWCLHYEPNDYYRYTKYGLEHLLEDQGFEIEEMEQFGNLPQIIGARLIDSFYEVFDFLTESKYRAVRFPAKFGLRVFLTPLNLINYYGFSVFPKRKDAFGWGVKARKEGE